MIGAITAGLFSTGVAASTNAYESIATTVVGSGGTTTISFTSIPSTYKHLQLRILSRSNRTAGLDLLSMQMNGDTGNNYSDHELIGDGTAAGVDKNVSYGKINLQREASDNLSAGIFSPFVVDILDYGNTNKYKTVRYLGGYDANGSGRIVFGSGLWQNTAAITSISLQGLEYTSNFNQYSSFALYGIKG
jgi:hypothetical protein